MSNEGDGSLAKARNQYHRRVIGLIRRLGDVSSQTEALILEARQLIAWKAQKKPRVTAELTEEDSKRLAALKKARIAEAFTRACAPLLKSLSNHKWAFPFLTPVDTVQYFDYLKVVETPMDLSTIRSRLDSGHYKSPQDFILDVQLVFDNAMKYNPEGSDCYLMAKELKELADSRYAKNVIPRLQEDERLTLIDEQVVRKKRALAMDAADSNAVSRQVQRVLSFVSELQASSLDLQSEAASLCQVVSKEEKKALASALQSLSSSQMEAAMAFIAKQQPSAPIKHVPLPPPSACESAQPSVSGEQSAADPPRVKLVLGHYDSLLLRQLQHFVRALSSQPPSHPTQGPALTEPMDLDVSNNHDENPQPSTSLPSDPMDIAGGEEGKGSEPPGPSSTPMQAAWEEAGPAPASTADAKETLPPPSLLSKIGLPWPGLLLGSGVLNHARAKIDTGSDMEAADPSPALVPVKNGSGPRASVGMKRKAPAPIMVPPSGDGPGAGSLHSGPPSSCGRKQQKHLHAKHLVSPIPSPLEASILMPPPPLPIPIPLSSGQGGATPGNGRKLPTPGSSTKGTSLMPPPANRPPSASGTTANDKAKGVVAKASPSNGPSSLTSPRSRLPSPRGTVATSNPKNGPLPSPAASTSAPGAIKNQEGEAEALQEGPMKPPSSSSSAPAPEGRLVRKSTREQGERGKQGGPLTSDKDKASSHKTPLPLPISSPVGTLNASAKAPGADPKPAPTAKKNVSTPGFSKSAPLSSPRPVPSASSRGASSKDSGAGKNGDPAMASNGPRALRASEAIQTKESSATKPSAPTSGPSQPPVPPPSNGSSKPIVSPAAAAVLPAVLKSLAASPSPQQPQGNDVPLSGQQRGTQIEQQRQSMMIFNQIVQAAKGTQPGLGSSTSAGIQPPSNGPMSLEHPPGGAGVLDLSKLEGVPTQNHPQGNSTAISNPLASLSEAAKQQHIRQLVQLYLAHQQLLHQQMNTGPPENPAVDAADPNDAKSA